MQVDHLESIKSISGLTGEVLTPIALQQFSGELSGHPFIKVVHDAHTDNVHFINDHKYKFHADYIAEEILKTPREQIRASIDEFNRDVYLSPERRFYLGVISLQKTAKRKFFTLETVEVDNMTRPMLEMFFLTVKKQLSLELPLYWRPANHHQEAYAAEIDPIHIPRIFNHELTQGENYIALNEGDTRGRLRIFNDQHDYKKNWESIEWYDIIAMNRVPDSIPRVAGIINSQHTTPLSHTNVLAHGWQIPNAISIDIIDSLKARGLDGKWVRYQVQKNKAQLEIDEIEPLDPDTLDAPNWAQTQVNVARPNIEVFQIRNLRLLREADSKVYGTKCANLGELQHILCEGSERITGFYSIKRPPRDNLNSYLATLLKASPGQDLTAPALKFLRDHIQIPRGVAIPFSFQWDFLEHQPHIHQQIGKLKMALELKAKEVNSLCIGLQDMIKKAHFTEKMRQTIRQALNENLGDVSKLVVRSSSNAEDLAGFSAAGIYESVNRVTNIEEVFIAIKEVWASLVSTRSVHLRNEVNISLDDTFMAVAIQEEVKSDMGGVLVTTNPTNPADIRNVYINASTKSVVDVVEGTDLPYQFLYNTMEGGGRTMSLGSYKDDLPGQKKELLQKLALAGRLLHSHFSPDEKYDNPVDIEWASDGKKIYILQLRPYAN